MLKCILGMLHIFFTQRISENAKDIPVFVWHGQRDTTLPLSFVDYFVEEYSVKQVHKIDDAGICYICHIGMKY